MVKRERVMYVVVLLGRRTEGGKIKRKKSSRKMVSILSATIACSNEHMHLPYITYICGDREEHMIGRKAPYNPKHKSNKKALSIYPSPRKEKK